MNQELEAILQALEENGELPGDIDRARELSTAYVKAHPDEFVGYTAWGLGESARELTVRAVETFRAAGQREDWARAEAWHFHTWDPMNIGAVIQPTVRNVLQGG
jgi:hypothetical protein